MIFSVSYRLSSIEGFILFKIKKTMGLIRPVKTDWGKINLARNNQRLCPESKINIIESKSKPSIRLRNVIRIIWDRVFLR